MCKSYAYLFVNYALTIWRSQWNVQVDWLHCSQNISHGLEAQAELFLAPGVSPKWQENVTFTDSVFSEVFVFLLCAFVSDSWSSLTGILVGTQPTVIILVGGNNEWNLVLCSDHLNLVICRVEPESSLAHMKNDWIFVCCFSICELKSGQYFMPNGKATGFLRSGTVRFCVPVFTFDL